MRKFVCLCVWAIVPRNPPIRLPVAECRKHGHEAAEPTIAQMIVAAAVED